MLKTTYRPPDSGIGFKTAKQTKDGKKFFCKPWNDPRGYAKTPCKDVHACDILMASGNACGATNHTRQSHSGPKIPL